MFKKKIVLIFIVTFIFLTFIHLFYLYKKNIIINDWCEVNSKFTASFLWKNNPPEKRKNLSEKSIKFLDKKFNIKEEKLECIDLQNLFLNEINFLQRYFYLLDMNNRSGIYKVG